MKVDRWYKNSTVYCLDVETHKDTDGDGIGDFRGLTQSLDYLAGIGITCLWLLPFFPTPNRDNGYDIEDYYSIDPRLGDLGDFVDFAQAAHERGIRIIIDLVVNHTSNQHPWFQAASTNRHSKYHDFYVWSDGKPEDADEGLIFPGKQQTIWTHAPGVDRYYLHRFFEHQPDLNISNAAVRAEIRKIMGFWLELGVSGFRIDAAPFLVELKGIDDVPDIEPYHYIQEMREFLSWRRGDAILFAEANVSPEKVVNYVGDGNKMHMLFNFIVNQNLFLAIARQQAEPLVQALNALPEIPQACQWGIFVRNHDELALERLSEGERQEVIDKLNVDKDMWLYNRGPARRLPPIVENNTQRIKMIYSLMFTLPGTPVLRYGEEIGMGDDLSLPGRYPIRTPMQWSGDQNGGFSSAAPADLIRPVISEGAYGYEQCNVAKQERDPHSLLNAIELMIRTRRKCPEFGWGEWKIVASENPSVLIHRCTWNGGTVLAAHNLGEQPTTAILNVSDETAKRISDLLGDKAYTAIEGTEHEIELEGYGYRWFRIGAM